MATTTNVISQTILDTILADVNAVVPNFTSMVSSYRLLVGAAEEIHRLPGVSTDVLARAIERFDRTGVLIDILVDLLCCKISFSSDLLSVTCAPVDLFRLLVNPCDTADTPHTVAEEIILLEIIRKAEKIIKGNCTTEEPSCCTPPGPPPYTFSTSFYQPPPPDYSILETFESCLGTANAATTAKQPKPKAACETAKKPAPENKQETPKREAEIIQKEADKPPERQDIHDERELDQNTPLESLKTEPDEPAINQSTTPESPITKTEPTEPPNLLNETSEALPAQTQIDNSMLIDNNPDDSPLNYIKPTKPEKKITSNRPRRLKNPPPPSK